MTSQRLIDGAHLPPHPLGSCPEWCVRHEIDDGDCRWHVSAPHRWQIDYSLAFELERVRHDSISASELGSVGMTDFNIRVALPDEEITEGFEGAIEVREVRELARFLLSIADLADPHNTNGEPAEWLAGRLS
jgi:hypothetical protein